MDITNSRIDLKLELSVLILYSWIVNILRRKPGVIILPASALFIIFIILLVLFVGQKKSNNALILEHRALAVINFLQELNLSQKDFDPSGIDPNIIGFGIYNKKNKAVRLYGTAPAELPERSGSGNNTIFAGSHSIIIIRRASEFPEIMHHMSPFMGNHISKMRQRHEGLRPPPAVRNTAGIFLEYKNSNYISEQRLLILIIILFTILFIFILFFVFRLYNSNRRLLIKAEQDRQLVQLGEAARTLAHEIRNPLSALKIQRDLLKKTLPDDYKRNLDVMDRELARLNTLVNRVGEFLRNPRGNPEKIELFHFINNLYAERDDITIQGLSDDVLVCIDRDRLRIIIDNLVNNAVDSGGGAEIGIISGKKGDGFSVTDKGPGFSDEALERLYDPFFTTRNNGSGLGLSIVKRLVEAAGGSISVKNRKTGGASVTVEFGDINESSCS